MTTTSWIDGEGGGQLVENIPLGHLSYITSAAQGPDGHLDLSTFTTGC